MAATVRVFVRNYKQPTAGSLGLGSLLKYIVVHMLVESLGCRNRIHVKMNFSKGWSYEACQQRLFGFALEDIW